MNAFESFVSALTFTSVGCRPLFLNDDNSTSVIELALRSEDTVNVKLIFCQKSLCYNLSIGWQLF